MKSRLACCVFLLTLAAAAVVERPVRSGPNLRSLIPFGKRVEADRTKDYSIQDSHGPWMIMATSFSGEGAEQQARDLVIELRERFNVEAFQHRKTFDFTEPVIGLGVTKYGEPRKMRYRQSIKFDEIAVLVGNFDSPDSDDVQAALQKVKHLHPECLDLKKRKVSYQRFAGLRELQRRISPDSSQRETGPMRAAFITRNPLLPDSYFRPEGFDPLVLSMNKGVEHSLLNCPGEFTVQVAAFRGKSTWRLDEMDEDAPRFFRDRSSKLAEAADKAHRLVVALREKGVEAYEFHDRFESIVTVGSFASVGDPRPDGRVEINPQMHAIIETYRAQRRPLGTVEGLEPKMLDGVPFDVQPRPIKVPQLAVGKSYTQ